MLLLQLLETVVTFFLLEADVTVVSNSGVFTNFNGENVLSVGTVSAYAYVLILIL